MGAILTVEVESAEVEQFFADLAQRAQTPQDFLSFVGKDMVAKFRRNIDAESGGPDFPGWAALSKARVAERERHGLGGPHPMLKGETGDLYSHLVSQITGTESVSAGTDGSLIYPEVHDTGQGAMPQRSFVWIEDAQPEGWLEVLAAWLIEAKAPPTEAAA